MVITLISKSKKKSREEGERKNKGEMGKGAHTRAHAHTHSLGLTHTHTFSRTEPSFGDGPLGCHTTVEEFVCKKEITITKLEDKERQWGLIISPLWGHF